MNHDNPMTIAFVGDEMTLKATLLVCVLIVISKNLVSCIIGLKKKLQPSMTSTTIGMFFFMKIILCRRTSSLLMKQVDALESSNASVSIIMDMSNLIVINGSKKQGARSEGKLGAFKHMTHLNLVSWSLLRLEVFVS
jgi:hypothetical protein